MLICDYVIEVCSDPRLTSADPVQSHLLDGRCVADWGRKALQRLSTRIHQVGDALQHYRATHHVATSGEDR